ncbi:MAG: ExbD/TolR family protein [Planctomycetota bacterium]|jgi:biopolymer transport protein ExbD
MWRSIARLKAGQEAEERELPISMIDVVFLLLIFFMCSMQFKTIERKLDAQLPQDGPEVTVFPPPPPDPTEIRVKIYWANARGQVIHSPRAAFGERYPGRRVPLSTAGAHVELRVNQVRVGDLNCLARTLVDLNRRNPMPVVVDARQAVPFQWVVGALDACARAGVSDVKFQAPPVEGGGGADWWWM